MSDIPSWHAAPDVISAIRGLHRKRIDFHREEKAITLRCHAICRRLVGCVRPAEKGKQTKAEKAKLAEANALFKQVEAGDGDHEHLATALAYLQPFLAMRAIAKKERLIPEKAMAKLAAGLPTFGWMESINGFGAFGMAQIIGECGDLSNYANPAKVWKRMGLAVFDGKAQRRTTDKDAAMAMGYSPERRSIMWNIGDSLLKQQNEFRALYLERKAYERQKAPDLTKMRWHRRAQRYVEKRLLRDLWRAWRDAVVKPSVAA
jgi:hypothetical protein